MTVPGKHRIVCLSAVLCVAAVIALAATLEFGVAYSFEYPSCLFVRELRVWNMRVHCRKRASALSEYIRRNQVAIDTLPQRMLPVSVRTCSIRGVEYGCGGPGSDLMKFDLYIRHCPMEKAAFHALLALADGRRDDRQREAITRDQQSTDAPGHRKRQRDLADPQREQVKKRKPEHIADGEQRHGERRALRAVGNEEHL